MIPVNDQMHKLSPTEPAYVNTPLGDTKMPEPAHDNSTTMCHLSCYSPLVSHTSYICIHNQHIETRSTSITVGVSPIMVPKLMAMLPARPMVRCSPNLSLPSAASPLPPSEAEWLSPDVTGDTLPDAFFSSVTVCNSYCNQVAWCYLSIYRDDIDIGKTLVTIFIIRQRDASI